MDLKETTLPVLHEPQDPMEGMRMMKNETMFHHPVQAIQTQSTKKEKDRDHTMLSHIYGTHLPIKIKMEENILSQFKRVGGLRSSLLGLETLMGMDTEIEFEDFLDDADFRLTPQKSVLEQMEASFGDKPEPKLR
eukprot:TRINITY_DN10399_c0_g1_i1.p1 TRINITY_DN10399_c0_g1~~TRINITY_DN10399_c0_g1_i1.p1  ORF type:complete len:135 (+),score=30.59 TRINITY_DN10399_c0_g1_i1:206-610(+)